MSTIPVARRTFLGELATWQPRRWLFAAGTAIVTAVVVAIPTDLIPNPFFHRDVPVTPWAWPVLIITSVLAGLVAATYVARKDAEQGSRGGKLGIVGGIVTFFAVGCPVCNKLVLLALGYTGALKFFAPVQPFLAAISIILLAAAFVLRVRREGSCPIS